jgi:hypothetical protein
VKDDHDDEAVALVGRFLKENSPSLFEDILSAVCAGDVSAARATILHDDLRRLEVVVRGLRNDGSADGGAARDVAHRDRQDIEASEREARMRTKNEQVDRDLDELERRQQRRMAQGSIRAQNPQPN